MEWFYYDNSGSLTDPTNYYPVAVPSDCTSPKQVLCAISAFRQIINGHPRPIITAALQSEIAAALATLTESANVLLKPAP